MTYEEAVSKLFDTPRFSKKNSIEHTRRLLRALGHPEESFHIVHVAGSVGKGSTCSFIKNILDEAGYVTGIFTSPHLTEPSERIRVKDKDISHEDFAGYFAMVTQCARKEIDPPTFFEVVFLMGMCYFRDAGIDIGVLETGLGGRLDATNAPASKDLCVITKIALEHTDILGDTLDEIAPEKAGIMRKGVPAVFLDEPEEACAQILKKAKETGAKPKIISKKNIIDVKNPKLGIDFSYKTEYDIYRVKNGLLPGYQAENIALAIEAALIMLKDKDPLIRRRSIEKGVEKTLIRGRMHEIRRNLFVDGAHNPAEIAAFLGEAQRIISSRRFGSFGSSFGKKAILILGMMKDKDTERMMADISGRGIFDAVIPVTVKNKRAMDATDMGKMIDGAIVIPDSEKALEYALSMGENKGENIIFVTGSMYLVGEITGMYEGGRA